MLIFVEKLQENKLNMTNLHKQQFDINCILLGGEQVTENTVSLEGCVCFSNPSFSYRARLSSLKDVIDWPGLTSHDGLKSCI